MFGPYNHDMIVCIKRQIRMHESYHFFTNFNHSHNVIIHIVIFVQFIYVCIFATYII